MSESSPNTSSILRNCPDYGSCCTISSSPITNHSGTNSENWISTPISKKTSSEITSSPISPCYGNTISSSLSVSENNPEIQAFLSSFNSRFNVEVFSLNDVLDVVSELSRKSTAKQQKVPETKNQQQNSKILEEISSLTLQNADLKSKLTEKEHSNVELTSRISSLQEKLKVFQEQNESLRSSISSMQEMYEAQLNECKGISEQKCKLIDIVQRQASIINALDSIASSSQAQLAAKKVDIPIKQAPKANANSDNELYSCLVTASKMLDEMKIDNVKELKDIKENQQLSVKERILMMIKILGSRITNSKIQMQNTEGKIKELNDQNTVLHDKCLEILSLFEEQLRFLQKLTHSTDLQNVVFYQESNGTSLYLSEENKSELIRKCAVLGSFVEDTIAEITQEQLNDVIRIHDDAEQKRIFELLQPINMEKTIKDALDCVNGGKEFDARELFDILCAQIFMNSLLKNYAKELSLTASRRRREIDALQQNADNEDYEKQICILQKRESKVRNFLFKFIDADETTPTFKLLKMVFSEIQNELLRHSQPSSETQESSFDIHLSSESSKVASSNKSNSKKSSNVSTNNSVLQKKIEELTANLNVANNELQQQTEFNQKTSAALDEMKNQLANVKNELQEKDKQIFDQKNQLESSEKQRKEIQEKFSLSEAKCTELTKLIEDNEKTLLTFKKQRKVIAKKIQQIDKCNIELRKQNETVKEDAQKQILEFTQKHQTQIDSLQTQLQSIIHEAEGKNKQIQDNEANISKLNSEITNLTIQKNTLEIKLKAYEQSRQAQVKSNNIPMQDKASKEKISELQKEMNDVFARLCNINTTGAVPNTLMSAVECVEATINNLKQQQFAYVDLIEEIEEAQKLLGVSPNDKITDAIRNLLSKSYTSQSSSMTEKNWESAQEEITQIRATLSNAQSQLVTLKKWENWSRRIYGVIFDSEPRRMTSDSIRMALDEALLSSVSHRSIFMKIDSLRNQKQMLLRYERTLLTTKAPKKQSFRAAIILVCAARKMMKLSGCLPIAPLAPKIRETPRKPIIPQKFDETPRPTKRSSRERSARKPVVPIYV